MCIYRNTEARSFNHCCSRKAMSIAYSECVFVALVARHSQHMRPITWSSVVWLDHIFPHYLIKSAIFEKKNIYIYIYIYIYICIYTHTYIEHKMCISIFATTFV